MTDDANDPGELKKKALDLYAELTKQVITLCVVVIGTFVAGLRLFDLSKVAVNYQVVGGLVLLFLSVAVGLLGYGRLIGLSKKDVYDLNDKTLLWFGKIQQGAFFVGTALLAAWMVAPPNGSDAPTNTDDAKVQSERGAG